MSWLEQFKEERILIQTDGIHNKYWAACLDEGKREVHVRWGRIGTKGMSQSKTFKTEYQAVHYLDTKFNEKYRKGYTNKIEGALIDRTKLEELAVEAAIVGTQNKCHGIEWVELDPDDPNKFKKVHPDRLYDPDCTPALLVQLHTKQTYDNKSIFVLLFTGETVVLADFFKGCDSGRGYETVSASHPLHPLTKKVEEAIGRKLS